MDDLRNNDSQTLDSFVNILISEYNEKKTDKPNKSIIEIKNKIETVKYLHSLINKEPSKEFLAFIEAVDKNQYFRLNSPRIEEAYELPKKPITNSRLIKIPPKTLAGVVYGAIGLVCIGAIAAGVHYNITKSRAETAQPPVKVIEQQIPAPTPHIYVAPQQKEAKEIVIETPAPKEPEVIITEPSPLSDFYIKSVKPGETLHEIVENYLLGKVCEDDFARCKNMYVQLAQANEINDPNKIVDGQIILLPRNNLTSINGLIDGSEISEKNLPRRYVVMKKGQTLDDLSGTLMGNYDKEFVKKIASHPLNHGLNPIESYIVPYGERWVWIPNDVQVNNKELKTYSVPSA